MQYSSVNELYRIRLREAANNFIQAIGGSEAKAIAAGPFLDNLLQQTRARLPGYPAQSTPQITLSQVQIMTGLQMNQERFRIAIRLAGFDPKDNIVTKEITRRFGSNIKQGELINIAEVIAEHAKIKLDRDARRRKNVLLKWFEEHWAQIKPYLDWIVLEDTKDDKGAQLKEDPEPTNSV